MKLTIWFACASFVLLPVRLLPAQTSLTADEIRAAIATGVASTTDQLQPMRLAFGAQEGAVDVAYVYPPHLRVALAAATARDGSRAFDSADVTSDLVERTVYVVVPSHPGMAAIGWRHKVVRAEHVVAAVNQDSDRGRIAALWVRDYRPEMIPGHVYQDGTRVFGFPSNILREGLSVWVFFTEPAINTGGESGREILCTLRPAMPR